MKTVRVKNTYDIKISGCPSTQLRSLSLPKQVAVVPSSIPFIKPKLSVKIGDEVSIGSPIFYDKRNPELVFLSPAGGEVVDIQYGPRRRIDAVVIALDDEESIVTFDDIKSSNLDQMSREEVVFSLMKGGLWGMFREFPFKRIPKPDVVPPAIYVSLDSDEPYRPQSEVVLSGKEDLFRFGLSVLKRLTETVYLGCSVDNDWAKETFSDCLTHQIEGAYPANDPGVFLYHTKVDERYNRSWTIGVQDILAIASLFQSGQYSVDRVVVSAGSSVSNPTHYQSRLGAPVRQIVGALKRGSVVRYVVGGILTGRQTDASGFLGYTEDAVHVLPEGDSAEMFYFFKPGFTRPTRSNTYFSALIRGSRWIMDTYLNGGERSCIACGECPQVCPVDLAPQFIYKSLKAGEVEEPLSMGLLDCVECGLCSYVCPSKIEVADTIIQMKHSLEKEVS